MSIQVKAIFENGVLRPLQRVELLEQQEVTVTIEEPGLNSSDVENQAGFALTPERWQAFCDALDAPPKEIPALRKLLMEPSLFDDGTTTSAKTSPS